MNILDFLILGIIGGLTPGPITALLLGETFKHGWRSGIKIPFAMLFSNLILAPLAVGLLLLGSQIDSLLELITYAGAAILLIMGIQEWQSSGELDFKTSSRPFQKSLILDFVNPHPYIFWFTILAPPIVLQINSEGISGAIPLWTSFVGGLIGTKILLVLLANQIKHWLNPTHVRVITKFLAFCLVFFGLKLIS